MNPVNPNAQLTDEDTRTMRRCRQLSFWRGSVPFTIGSVLSVGIAQNMGYFANRPKLRAPCYVLAVIGGYLGGKMSYFGTCRKMFLELQDSRIKDYLLDPTHHSRPPGSRGESPIIVNTPVDGGEPSNIPKTMTYAERRDFYQRQQFGDSPSSPRSPMSPPPPIRDMPPSDSNQEERPPIPSYFNEERPSSSYQFDDVYRPRD